MKIGVTLRNMGPQSTAEMMRSGAQWAEQAGFESVWITDHIAIPPDDAEGSGGRYTDPLTTLAWLAGATSRINLAVGVLILPYRAPLPTVKQIATVQELSAGRLIVGAAVGWMAAEFRALGVNRHERGKLTDETLALLARCFADDIVSNNGQDFIFSPRPPAPPVYIGGSAPHALQRALRFDCGWLPMVRDIDRLEQDLVLFRRLAGDLDKSPGPVTVMSAVASGHPDEARRWLDALRDLGVERMVCSLRYHSTDDYRRRLDRLAPLLG